MKKPLLFFVNTFFLFYCGGALAEKVSCPAGTSWTFEGHCVRYLNGKADKCEPGTTLKKLSATGPLLCEGRGRCLSDSSKVPNAKGVCVDPEEVKPIPRQFTQKMVHTTPKPEPAKTE
jgi:hypothetical protein